ncbi:nucleotidyltransferase family protein [Helicobacter pullorum]
MSLIKIDENAKLQEALQKIGSKDGLRILIVENAKGDFVGILSDPDIRRGILSGMKVEDTIKNIVQRKPIVAHIDDDLEKLLELSAMHNIYQIPIVNNDGKVVKIEKILEKLVSPIYPNRVVIMAGGLGTRLRPLTENIPKPMLKVGDKPILQIIIEKFYKQGFREITLCVNYKSHIIEDYFEDGTKFDVNISYVKELKRMGTAGALGLINDIGSTPFIVTNGDILTEVDYGKMLEFHIQKKSLATMGVREYSYQNPYGVIREKMGIIQSIEEKPYYNFLVNSGIYILDPLVINKMPKDTYFDMTNLFEQLMPSQRTYSYPIRDYWIDIGRISEYEQANIDYKNSLFEKGGR